MLLYLIISGTESTGQLTQAVPLDDNDMPIKGAVQEVPPVSSLLAGGTEKGATEICKHKKHIGGE